MMKGTLARIRGKLFGSGEWIKTSTRIRIELPIFVADKSGIIQIGEIRQKHPRGQRLKLEQANKQSNGKQWIWNECKETKKQILRAEEYIDIDVQEPPNDRSVMLRVF